MMEAVLPRSWKEQFALAAAMREEDIKHREKLARWKRLGKERQELLDYQAKFDDARDRLGKGEITEADLKRMEDNLRDAMPEAVRAKIEPDKLKAEAAPATSLVPDGMDVLMRQTGLGPSPSAGQR